MKQLLKSAMLTSAMLAVLCTISPGARAADNSNGPLIVTLKTNIYGYIGPTNSFSIYLGATEDDTEFYVEGPKTAETIYVDRYNIGTGSDGEAGTIATQVTFSVTESDNEVRIYGDASKLDFLDFHGCYLSSIVLSPDFTNLSVVDFSHNELTAIDLSPYRTLNSIDLSDNAFTVPSNMKIGADHPELLILNLNINDVIDPELDLSNYPILGYFSAYSNYGLTSIDVSGCPNLRSLSVDATNISSIDVSKNPILQNLNVSQTKVTSVDLSNNPLLYGFYANHDGSMNTQYKLTSIDLSKNPDLVYLDLGGNALTEIDLSNNPKIYMLYLMRNQLTSLNLSNQTNLGRVDISRNYLNFANLPYLPNVYDYIYDQYPLKCDFKYRVGQEIDFSAQVIRAPFTDSQGNTITPQTDARVFLVDRLGDSDMVDPAGGLYTYADGKITFNQPVEQAYIRFANSIFNEFDLDTQNFSIRTDADFDAPSVGFNFTPYSSMYEKEVSFSVGLTPIVENVSLPAEVTVVVGDETIGTFDVESSGLPEEDNVTFTIPATGGQVKVFVTDGFSVSSLSMDNIKMSAIDLSYGDYITYLAVTNANLPNVNLQYNRELRTLNLSGNLLTTIDLTPIRGDFEKWELKEIILANNNMSSFTTNNSIQYLTLNLANNWFTDFDLKYFTALRNLDLSGNRLSGELELQNQTELQNLDISGNKINSIVFGTRNLNSLNVTNNNLSFATLPAPTFAQEYSYAPQNPYSILAGGASINLSAQNVGQGTTFVWKYDSDKTVLPADMYTITDGITRFNPELVGTKVFCEMTNPMFPDFNSQPLTTTSMTVMEKPTTIVASFTPAESGRITIGFTFANRNGANAVYVDWMGDGSQYDEYIYDQNNTAIYRDGTAYKDKTAVVYTYGAATDVTGLFMNNAGEFGSAIKLKNLDATPMTAATAIDIHNAGLTDGSIKLPVTQTLTEAVFDGNAFVNEVIQNVDGGAYNRLYSVVLANNKYKTFDISKYPSVSFLNIADNQIASLTMPSTNKNLYQLQATNNQISEINLDCFENLSELLLTDNRLSEIDLEPLRLTLHALTIAGNYFTFATMPTLLNVNPYIFTYYDYFSQQPMQAVCNKGVVDLSDQLVVNNLRLVEDSMFEPWTEETTYRWFLGNKQSDVYYDYYYEMFVGQELEGPDQNPEDPEYYVKDGKTYFNVKPNSAVICAMTNPALPKLILYTKPLAVDEIYNSVGEIAPDDNTMVDVFTVSGVRVRHNVERREATRDLAPGLYIVGGRKVIVK